ncbi:MAG: hypothetical protein R3F46_10920 [bacterium]
MSELTIQWVITILIVGLAAFQLLRQLLGLCRKPETGCGSACRSCNTQELLDKRLASLDDH